MMIKPINRFFFLFIAFSLSAADIRIDGGFEAQHDCIFLDKNKNEYMPDTISNTAAAVFSRFDIIAGNQSFLLQPGILIKDKKLMPFFRKLRYSLFTETFSLSAGKDTFSFGEGNMKHYFSVHTPQPAGFGKKAAPVMWQAVCEAPVRRFLFTAGVFFDADSTAAWKAPRWYSLAAKASYSNSILSAGIETDALFQPALKGDDSGSLKNAAAAQKGSGMRHTLQNTAQKKAYTATAAAEISVVLPYTFKLYTNAQLPVDLLHGKITDWGALFGISKDFLFRSVMLNSIAEASYSAEGFSYAFFQTIGVSDYLQLSAGFQGLEAKNGVGIVQAECSLSDFTCKLSYITKNLIKNNETEPHYHGIFSVAVGLNGD